MEVSMGVLAAGIDRVAGNVFTMALFIRDKNKLEIETKGLLVTRSDGRLRNLKQKQVSPKF